MRLNWFLPSRGKGKPGVVRRTLRMLGPTWLASPARRLAQTIGLLGFLVLFGYVCWPYTSRPVDVSSAPSRSWGDWIPLEVDEQSGKCVVVSDTSSIEASQVGMLVRVRDDGPDAAGAGELGTFHVNRIEGGDVGLAPVNPLSPRQLDTLSTSFGPWSFEEIPEPPWPSHYADGLAGKEIVEAELVLALDPLVGLSTSLASRTWVWSLTFACVLLAVCLVVPRGFCGYVCPLGTLIDVFDWVIGPARRWLGFAKNGRPSRGGDGVKTRPWWVRVKYYLLSATLAASLWGVLLAGFVAAIPLLTRGLAYLVTPLQTGLERGWHQVPPINAGQFISLALLAGVLGLGLAGRRFWCKYVCPSGALFSLANLARVTSRKVRASCVACGRCVEVCPFDAIRADYGTRGADCTFCQTCGGVCPVGAIQFVGRWTAVEGELAAAGETDRKQDDPSPSGPRANRRDFLGATLGVVGGATGGLAAGAVVRATGAPLDAPGATLPVRPPGSLPEAEFLQTCIRCGECLQACPNDVLQPAWLEQGVQGLWAPRVVADWSGCEVSCNNCGQVCPTGAIRAIPLKEKRVARMGLAVVNEKTCLPYAGVEECQLCVDECKASGYDAIEFRMIGAELDDQGNPIEGGGFLAPAVLAQKCVGCGLCQTRCRAINVAGKRLLRESAILVEAGPGKQDRLANGSYLKLRQEEKHRREEQRKKRTSTSSGGYRTDFLDSSSPDEGS